MENFLVANEPLVRLICFFGIFAGVALVEIFAPRRALTVSKRRRWTTNLGLVVVNGLAVRLLVPILAVGLATKAAAGGWGVLNIVDWPVWLEIILAVIVLDAVIYLQHVMVHAVPLFWRLHMVHHADLDFDVTTGARFHTIEIFLSMAIKLATVLVLGPAAVAVIIFEVLLNATSMFNHGNISLPAGLDRVLRLFVVTPDMHRVHHSIVPSETNSNFGFSLPWWDWIFGTYRAQPGGGHKGMTIGLSIYRDPERIGLLGALALPVTGTTGGYPLNRKDGAS